MRTSQMPGGNIRVFLSPHDYRIFLESAPNDRAKVSFRLAGEAGLKVSELANVQISHIRTSDVSDNFFFLRIPLTEDDESLEFARGRPRDAYLPNSVRNTMLDFAEDMGRSHHKPLFQVTKRTLQEDFKQAGEAASSSTGNDDFHEVSSKDLRIYFAKQAIERNHIHPNVVMQIGGWNTYENLKEMLESPDEALIVREFERAKYLDSLLDD